MKAKHNLSSFDFRLSAVSSRIYILLHMNDRVNWYELSWVRVNLVRFRHGYEFNCVLHQEVDFIDKVIHTKNDL